MNQIKLGKSELLVSEMGLGCLNFGTRTSQKDATSILDYYVEQGGNFLDTSNNYAFWNENAQGGESEVVLGEWMRQRKNRQKIVLSTKVGAMPKGNHRGFSEMEGLSKEVVTKDLEDSLRRLKTDYIDLYYAHIDDVNTPLEETLEVFDSLVASGKVRAIACSNYDLKRLKRAHQISEVNGWQKYCSVQQRYSYLQPKQEANFGVQKIADPAFVNYCREMDMQLIAYAPLLGGYYTTKRGLSDLYLTEDLVDRMKLLEAVAVERGITPNQVVLAWMIQQEHPVIPLVAVSRMEQLVENLEVHRIKLTDKQLQKLNTAKNIEQ